MTRKTIHAACAVLALLGTSILAGAQTGEKAAPAKAAPAKAVAARMPGKPKTVIHVITVKWKDDASQEQIDKALKAVESMKYPGLKNVWTRPIKMQLPEGYKNIIVMEFASEAALKNYSNSPAQKAWYEVYMPIRDESRTHDITN